MPTVSRPIPCTRGRLPVATRSRSPRSSSPPVEGEDELRAVAAGGGGVPPQRQLDAVAAQGFAERVTERLGLAGQHPVGRLDDHGLAAEAAHDLGQLDARRPTAEHQQPPRHLLHARRLAGAPHAVELRRPGTGGTIGSAPVATTTWSAVCRTPSTSTDAGARQLALAAQQRDAVVGQPALLTGVGVVRHHVVAPRERGRDVDLGARRRLARAVHRLARAQQRLGRDARPVRALAADQLPLDDGHPQPARGDRGGAVLAGRPAAQDDHVVVAHGRARSRRQLRPGRARRPCRRRTSRASSRPPRRCASRARRGRPPPGAAPRPGPRRRRTSSRRGRCAPAAGW